MILAKARFFGYDLTIEEDLIWKGGPEDVVGVLNAIVVENSPSMPNPAYAAIEPAQEDWPEDFEVVWVKKFASVPGRVY